MDIQILNIAELLLFVFMICTCIRIYRQKKQKGKISLKTLIMFLINYICLFNYLFISSQMSAKPYFIGSTGIFLLW